MNGQTINNLKVANISRGDQVSSNPDLPRRRHLASDWPRLLIDTIWRTTCIRDLWWSAGRTTTTSPSQPPPDWVSSWRVSSYSLSLSLCHYAHDTAWHMTHDTWHSSYPLFADPTSRVNLAGPASILAGDVATFTCVSHNVSGHSTFRWEAGDCILRRKQKS